MLLTAYTWLILLYVVFNFIYIIMNKRGSVITTLRTTTYDFCKPLFKSINRILPSKFSEFTPLIAFLFMQILIRVIARINF
ncbi:MAG: YggT family protein [Bacilli bacterium]